MSKLKDLVENLLLSKPSDHTKGTHFLGRSHGKDSHYNQHLVGGWPTLWKIWKSVGVTIPNIWKKTHQPVIHSQIWGPQNLGFFCGQKRSKRYLSYRILRKHHIQDVLATNVSCCNFMFFLISTCSICTCQIFTLFYVNIDSAPDGSAVFYFKHLAVSKRHLYTSSCAATPQGVIPAMALAADGWTKFWRDQDSQGKNGFRQRKSDV